MHEDYSRAHTVQPGSNRSFGLVMAGAFTVIGLLPMWRHLRPRPWALGVAGAFLLLALVRPALLTPLNIAWTKLGLLLNKVTSPVLLAIVFYAGVLPTGLLMRALGKDPMRRTRDPKATSYWIPRSPDE